MTIEERFRVTTSILHRTDGLVYCQLLDLLLLDELVFSCLVSFFQAYLKSLINLLALFHSRLSAVL